MSVKHFWVVTAIKSSSEIAKGMEVEVLVENSDRKPTIKEVCSALSDKYDIKNYGSSGISELLFEYEKS